MPNALKQVLASCYLCSDITLYMRRSALVTGGAGFIGSHLVERLLRDGWSVTVVDNFDLFYDPAIKRDNILAHYDWAGYRLVEADLRNMEDLRDSLEGGYDVVVHLAARAGVRASIERPIDCQEVNVNGTHHLLELAREWGTPHFVFASSSSVYGVNPNVPWSEDDHVLRPISPYASSKVGGELLGHVYSHLYGIRFLALRFFTVYGPRQRPDLAFHKFADRILDGRPIPVYGDGSTRRDYTFVDDIVDGIVGAMHYEASDYEVFNLGNDSPVTLQEVIAAMEQALGVKARRQTLPAQPGDVPQTWASIEKARQLLHYEPQISLTEGLERFATWMTSRETETLSVLKSA